MVSRANPIIDRNARESPSSPRVLVIGASVRAAAHSLVRAGMCPVAADLFLDSDLPHDRQSVHLPSFSHELVDVVRSIRPDFWMYTGGLENYQDLIQALIEIAPLWGVSGDALRFVRNPECWTAFLRDSGVTFIPATTCNAHSLDGFVGNWIQKPLRSCGGRNIQSCTGAKAVDGYYFQELVEGDSFGALYLAAEGQCQLIGVCQQLLGTQWHTAGEFQYAGSIGPIELRKEFAHAVFEWGRLLSSKVGLRGLFGIDFILNENGAWPIEVNPRYTASVELYERVNGSALIAEHAKAFVQHDLGTPQLHPAIRGSICGKAIVYATHNSRVTNRFMEYVWARNRRNPWPAIADIPRVDERIVSGQPICSVFSEGQSQESVAAKLRELCNQVRRLLDRIET